MFVSGSGDGSPPDLHGGAWLTGKVVHLLPPGLHGPALWVSDSSSFSDSRQPVFRGRVHLGTPGGAVWDRQTDALQDFSTHCPSPNLGLS